MHLVRSLTAIGASLFLLVSVQASLMAQTTSLPVESGHSPLDDTPLFTQLLTITLETGYPTATALFSRWENAYQGFPVGPGGIIFSMATPGDSTDITASVQHGSFHIAGTTVYFTLTESSDFSWAYRTAEKVRRTGNQFQIDQFARSNNFYRYVGTVYFPPPYQYVGSITFTPQIVTSDTLHWDLIVPQNTPPDRHVFNTSSWLVDPRLGQPDLSFTFAAMSIDTHLNPPIAHLTATIRNNNDVDIASSSAFLEFYDRSSPSTPPTGPLDHDGGWCGADGVPVCPTFATFTNPVPSIAPSSSLTITAAYPLRNPGQRDYYFQIDSFGGASGLNVEFNELNNVYTLAQDITIDYLESVAISGPLTGTAHTAYGFDALISPTLAVNRPLTYTWLPSPLSGQGTAHATYAWDDGSPHQISVTASNAHQVIVTGTHVISLEVPLSSVSLSGPLTVSLNTPHTFHANTAPLTATQPVVYLWEPEPEQGQYTTVATYTFLTLGDHVLTVYANNPIGPEIVAQHALVSVPPLTAAAIDGPDIGRINDTSVFTATIQPLIAAPPLAYLWSPPPASGQGTANATYFWTTSGQQDIHVAVSNDSGTVTGTHAISIAVPLTSALITGPSTVSQFSSHTYSVSLQPISATPPFIYVWTPEPDQGQGTAAVAYTLAELGEHTLTVEVTNPIGPLITATRTVVSVPPLTAVNLQGPFTGAINATLAFTATVEPAEAALPIDYLWSPTPLSGQGTPNVTYRWSTPVTDIISVTARNDSGSVTAQQAVAISGANLYLPLIRK